MDDSAVADLDGLEDGGGERFTSAPSPGNSRSSMITLVCNEERKCHKWFKNLSII